MLAVHTVEKPKYSWLIGTILLVYFPSLNGKIASRKYTEEEKHQESSVEAEFIAIVSVCSFPVIIKRFYVLGLASSVFPRRIYLIFMYLVCQWLGNADNKVDSMASITAMLVCSPIYH